MRFRNLNVAAIATGLVLSNVVMSADSATFLRNEGNEQEYNLHLDQALSRFRQAVLADPNDPASYRALAGLSLLQIAFERGAVTMDDFLDGAPDADSVSTTKPTAALAEAFRANAERAFQLAEARVRAHPDDADAHYQLAAAVGLQASYAATVNGQIFAAFKLARRAYQESRRTLELDPGREDAGLIIGLYQYILSLRSLPVRWFGKLGGIDSDRAKGVALIEAAARYPGETQTDARLALVLIYNRERRFDDALAMLSALRTRYPDNRLLAFEAGATLLRANRFQDAERAFDRGLAALAGSLTLRAFGEEALWRYKRGIALAELHRDREASRDLQFVVQHDARDWVHGRAHAELGKLAVRAGDHATARQEFLTAAQLAKTASDPSGRADAERLLNASHRQTRGE